MPTPADQFTPHVNRGLDIEALISAPLVAISKANAVMAQGQTRFLLEYCFKSSGDHYEPVMIQLSVSRTTMNTADSTPESAGQLAFEQVTTYFAVPLLTIVPLNSLGVDKASIDFDLEITAAAGKPTHPTNQSDNRITDKKAELFGRISDDPRKVPAEDTRGRRAINKIKVNLNASTLPLPQGVLTIIDMYNKSILPVSAKRVPDQPDKNHV